MAKAQWKALLDCKDCYYLMKNASQLNQTDKVRLYVFNQTFPVKYYYRSELYPPLFIFDLSVSSLIRPYGQQNRQLLSVVDEKSVLRCSEILDNARKQYFRSLWISSHFDKLKEEIEQLHQIPLDCLNKKDINVQWRRKQKQEIQTFIQSFNGQVVYQDGSCYVDFYLHPEDKHGIIYKIKNNQKLNFIETENGQRRYIPDSGKINDNTKGKKISSRIHVFVAEIYQNDRIKLVFKGQSQVIKKDEYLSLENILEGRPDKENQIFNQMEDIFALD